MKFVIGHEPAWSYCSSLAGYGGSFCPATNIDNLTPAYRPRPYSTAGDWTQPYGRHWADSLGDSQCPAGSREAFWSMLGRHQVVAHIVGHEHTYYGRLVQADGFRRNDIHPYTKADPIFPTAEGIWEVATGQAHTSAGNLYVLVTVNDNLVTFETFDQRTNGGEPFLPVERWRVAVGSPPAVNITTPVAGASFGAPATIAVSASATDPDGSVTQVAFLADGNPIGTALSAPFSTTWQEVAAGTYQLTAVATDDSGLTRTSAPVTVTVTGSNTAPVLAPINAQSVNEGTLLTVPASATDADVPAQPLTYSLVAAPVAATINPTTGVFTWTPSESDGPGTFPVTIRVTDTGTATAEVSFTITVTESNTAPVLAPISAQSVNEGTLLTVPANATDADLPAEALTFSLVAAPAGASITPTTGVFTWTPSLSDGPGTFPVTIRVTDTGTATADASFTITVTESNSAPVLAPISNQSIAEATLLTVPASATDADLPAQALTYSLVAAPTGAAVAPATGVFTWTPGESDGPGTFPVTIRVTDSATATAETSFTITVTESNSAPVLAAISAQSIAEATLLTVPASATDADLPAQALTYSLVAAPAGATVNPTTGVFTWTPSESDGPGTFPVTIRVTDTGTATAEVSFTITVTESNTAPVLAPITAQSVNEGTLLTVAAAATDADLPAETLTYSLVNGPAGAAVAPTTGVFTWTPGESDGPGTFPVTIRVTDTGTATAETSFTITVTESNTAPVLAPISAQSVNEGTLLTVPANATDADLPAQALTYSLVAAPAGASIHPTTGVFTWTPSLSDGPGTFPVTIRVTDTGTATADASFTITVTESNSAPVLAPISNQSIAEATLLTVPASATDTDLPAQALTYSLVAAPAGAGIHPTTGVFTWTPSESDGPGTFPVTIRVTDTGTATADASFTITVTESNTAPVLAPITAQSVNEGTLLTVAAAATDADLPAQALTYSLVAAPAGAGINPTTGVFTWTPSESDGPGTFPVTIRVTDTGTATVETSFTITVTESNTAPVLAPISNQSIAEATLLTVPASATDADLPTETLTYSLVAAPAGATVNPTTGVFTWTPSESEGPGTFPVTIRVTDSATATADASFTIAVTESNSAPVLAPITAQSVNEGTLLTVAAVATDADLPAETLTFSLVAAPAGATVNPTTGVFTWTPSESDGPGAFPVTIRVTDTGTATAEVSFTITVTESNTAPVLAPISAQSVNEGALLTVAAAATDADLPAQALTYSLVAAPAGASIHPTTGVFTWTPSESDGPGTFPVTIRVTDSATATSDASFTITVTESNSAPLLAPISNQSIAEATLLTVPASATDADLPAETLTFSLVTAPAGAGIHPTTGVFTWTPSESDGPGTFPVTIRVTDSATATADASFTITVTESNTAPVLAPISAQSVNEGALLTVAAAATDADLPAQALTYSLVTAPAGATVNPTTGLFTWTPSESDGPGTFPVTIRVTDTGTATAETSFTVTVTESNSAPVLAPITAQSVNEGTLLTVAAAATDADLPAQALTYSLVAAPAGASIHPTTGVFTWTPGESDGPGTFPVTIRVTDSAPATAETSFTITVTESNTAPVLAPISNQSIAEASLLTVPASATDADLPAETLTFSLVTAPAGASIHPTTGVFTWTPSESDGPGTFPVTIRVTDSGTATAETSFTITVTESNTAPLLAPITAQSVNEGTLLTVAAAATDADLPAQLLTYSLVAAPAGATVNPTTGVFTWTPSESDGPGTFPVTIRVTDSATATADASFTITVTESNSAPVLAPITAQSVNEGTLLTVAAVATDADLPAQLLTYSLVAAPAGATVNPTTGVFTWTPSESDGPGTFPVTIRVTDTGTATAETSFTITVTESNTAPVLASISAQSVNEGTLLTVAAVATDADLPAETLTFSLVTAPAGASIHPTTGVFTWTPSESDGPGTFPVTIRVTDSGTATAETSFTITVTESNTAPLLAPITAQSVNEGTLLTVAAAATDADLPAQLLTYSLVAAPAGATVNPTTGVFTWTPSESDGPGTFPVTVRVTDTGTATAETSFTITVTESNTAPVLAPISNQSIAEATLLTVPASATDADLPAEALTYSLVAAPAGASIHPTTGVFTWTPSESDGPGTFPVTIRVTDSATTTADASFTITVTESNTAPLLAPITAQSVNEGTLLTVAAAATDADLPAQLLTYSLVAAPAGATVNPTTGVFTWTPSESDGPGTFPVTIRVTDTGTATAETSFTVTVTESNSAPVLAPISNQSIAEGTLLTVAAAATDADLPTETLTFSLVTGPAGAAVAPTTGVFSWTPSESDGPGTFPVTIRVTDTGTATAEVSFTITVTESNTAPVLAPITAQSVNEGALLTVAAAATDADLPAQLLTYSLVAAPAGASINPTTGVFTWTPSESDGPGTFPVTIRVTDSATATADASFTITVTESNSAPVLAPISNQSIAEATLLTVPASATDADLPAETLTYSLVTAPAGAGINPTTGVFTWTPSESDGPGTFPVTIRVTDSATATADASFTITVTESNSAPVLAPISNQSIAEATLLTVPASATDADLPAQALTYSLVAAPAGATVNPTTGVFTWTPSESDGPGTFPVTIRVTDTGTATAEVSFTITVTESNTAPVLAPITAQSVNEGALLTVAAAATDADLPAQALTYSLVAAPAGATVNPTTAVFTWTPSESDGPGTFPVTIRVTDTGTATAETSFTVTVTESNSAPVLAPISNQSIAEATLLTVPASATDADLPAETLTYSLVTAPAGAGINPTTGVFTWTPSESDGPGTFPVTIRVTDTGTATAEVSFTITVTESNTAPVLAPITAQSVNEGALLTVAATATDADLPAQALTYSLVTAPAGATLNPTTGVFSWTPSESDGPGAFPVTIRVTDSGTATADASFTITVTESNSAPVLASITAQSVNEGTLLTVAAAATDADLPAQLLTYSLVTAPAGATLNPTTGVFTWTPGETDGPGTFPVTIRVTDTGTATAEVSFTITVTESNSAPVLAPISAQSVNEGTLLTVPASATDADLPAETLTYSLVNGPAGAAVAPTTGIFTWTPSESDGPGTFPVTIRVTDTGTATAEVSFTITVTESNSAPVLAPISAQSVNEGTLLTVPASATDADLPAQALTYSLVAAPAGATLNPTTGVFTWTPGESDGPGTFPVTIRVTDTGTATADASFTITVTESNSAPVLAPISNQSIAEATLLTVPASATDADLPAETLTYSLVNGPAGAAVAPTTGIFTWTPSESDGPGTFPVTIRVTDTGTATAEVSFTITVTESNSAPVLAPITAQSVNEGTLLTVAAAATDADLPVQALTYSLVAAPAGAGINPTTGVFTWTPGESDGPGTFPVTIRVTDSAPATAETSFTITVTESNSAPLLAPITAQSVNEGTLLTVAAAATDADLPAQALTYSLVAAPAGAGIHPTTGVFTWTPSESDGPGTFPVTIRVTDTGTATAEASFTITVTESNSAPVLASISAQSVNEGTLLTVAAVATDADLPAETLTFSLVTAPAGASIHPTTGVFTWTPSESDGPGTFPVTIRVTDSGTATAETSFTITVTESNTAPLLAPITAQSVNEGTLLTVAAAATDADLPAQALTYSLVTAPAGAGIHPTTGVFTWTPSESDGPGTFPVTIRVTDSATATADASFTITVTESNSAPVLAPITAQSVNEGTLLTVAAVATDADLPAQLLTYSLVAAPAGATVNPTTGVFTWTPSESDGPGTFPVTIRVTDTGTATAETSFTITVTESNTAPVLASISAQSVNEGTLLTVAAVATDADLPAETLTFSLVTAPAGASIHPTTGVFTWTPSLSDGPGTFPVTIRVTDTGTATADASFTITVTESNTAPLLAPITAQSVNEGTLLTVAAAATDADLPAQALTYSLVAAPAGAGIHPTTGVFTWTPSESDGPGTFPVTVRVTDTGTATAETSFTITVTESNTAPVLAPISNQSIAEATLLTVPASATDADLPAEALTYSLVAAPAGASIHPTTGVFTWTPSESDGPGTFPVTIRVTDSATTTADASFTITVTESNTAPLLAPITAQSVNEGTLLTVAAAATDADLPAQLLTYSLVAAPAGATVNPTTGVFTWTPSESDGPGTFPVTIRVTDTGTATAETSFTITVTESNTAPVLASISNQSIAEATLLTVPASATDADLPAETLTYSLVNGPAGAAIAPTTGVFTWTPSETDGPGTFPVTIRVTDTGTATAEVSFTITVTESNTAPVLAPITAQSVNEGTLLTVAAAATDADLPAQLLTYSLVAAPAGATLNPTTGVFTWTPGETDGPGTFPVTIRVTDTGTATAEVSFTITVTESNSAPVLAPIGAQSVNEGTLLTVPASATDADLPAETLTFSLVAAPAGASIHPTTGVFTWTPSESDGPGTFPVTIRVTDSGTATAETSFTITVTESNTAPLLAPITAQSVNEGTLLTVAAAATDADLPAQALTYSLVAAPAGAGIHPTTGVFTWTPSESDGPGTFPVTVRVTDTGTATAETSFTITVTESNTAPVLAPISNQSIAEATLLTVPASATDADLPAETLTFSLVAAPAGAGITPTTGVFTWTPDETDGPGTFPVTIRVTDTGTATAEVSFTITVTESNSAPVLAPISAQSVNEGTLLTVPASATDADLPAQVLTFSLVTAPAGASINPSTGIFTWTPSESDGPGTFPVTIRVTDSATATADASFTITVTESNSAPVLAPITAKSVNEGTLLTVAAAATDADLPAQALTYSLVAAPAGASITPTTGVFTWTPSVGQAGSHSVTIQVMDNGVPAATDSETFTVTVTAPTAPDLVLTALTTTATTVRAGATFSVSSTARNQGNVSSSAFAVTFRLSVDSAFGGADDIIVTAIRSISSLAASASSTGATTLTVPSSTSSGAYYVCGMADGNAAVSESNETNNTRCTSQPIQVARPDLIMATVQPAVTTVRRGVRFDVQNQVSNTGPVAAPASTAELRLSTNSVFGDADDIVLAQGTRSVGTVAAGASSTATTRPRVPLLIPLGLYYVCGMADVGLQVAESNEANNSKCSAATIQVIQ